MKKRLSPFSKDFWILKKGYSEVDAIIKVDSMRPIRAGYWIKKGYTKEEAEIKAKETKERNNRKGLEKSKQRTSKQFKESSVRCIEHWIKKGYTKEESLLEVKRVQSVGSLSNFKKRYGVVEGLKKWEERQKKWQNTLNSKSAEEIKTINKNKNSINLFKFIEKGLTIDEIIHILKDTRNMNLVSNIEDFKLKVEDDIKNNYSLSFLTPMQLSKKYQKIQLEILNIDHLFFNTFVNNIEYLETRGNKQSWRLKTDIGLLRSSFEIYFYHLCCQYNIKIKIDKCYPKSKERYDFYLIDYDIFVEICPMYNENKKDKYTIKMDNKRKKYNSVLLKSNLEFEPFLKGL